MLRGDLTLVQLLENACTASILLVALVLALYFILCVAGDIKTVWTKRRGGCD